MLFLGLVCSLSTRLVKSSTVFTTCNSKASFGGSVMSARTVPIGAVATQAVAVGIA